MAKARKSQGVKRLGFNKRSAAKKYKAPKTPPRNLSSDPNRIAKR
jgi:hypothetical protein